MVASRCGLTPSLPPSKCSTIIVRAYRGIDFPFRLTAQPTSSHGTHRTVGPRAVHQLVMSGKTENQPRMGKLWLKGEISSSCTSPASREQILGSHRPPCRSIISVFFGRYRFSSTQFAAPPLKRPDRTGPLDCAGRPQIQRHFPTLCTRLVAGAIDRLAGCWGEVWLVCCRFQQSQFADCTPEHPLPANGTFVPKRVLFRWFCHCHWWTGCSFRGFRANGFVVAVGSRSSMIQQSRASGSLGEGKEDNLRCLINDLPGSIGLESYGH